MKIPFTFSAINGGLPDDVKLSLFEKLSSLRKHLKDIAGNHVYSEDESSISLPDDEALIMEVIKISEKLTTNTLKYIFVIGIGGSSLGTKAVYDALLGANDFLESGRFPKILFLDTNDSEYLAGLRNFILKNISSTEEFAVTIITKSGNTTETIVNAEYALSLLEDKFKKNVYKRVCIITDEGSLLWEEAQMKKCNKLSIPKLVGGRYSVLSAVGLFPLSLAGINIKALRQGALVAREMSLADDIKINYAFLSAATLFHNYKNGKSIHDTFLFHPELESLGKWYRQLMGESIGKEKDITGKVVHAGMTPSASIGSTDLHSVGQLYLGGPLDKITTFVRVETKTQSTMIPEKRQFPDIIPQISGKSAQEIMEAIYEGVKIAYTKHSLPSMEIVLADISPYTLGGFLQFKMIEMMYLAELMEVNAFDQPNVKSYKIETKKILTKKES
jgi:glucose-6-phosphate isomerase